MDFQTFDKLVNTTRSTRRFKQNVEIAKSDLEEIVNLCRISSSSKNMQPLKYIIITDKKLVKILSSTASWAGALKTWDQSETEQPSAYILMIKDTNIEGNPVIDAGISLQTISLAAKTKGFAACALGSIDKEFCTKEFKLANNLEPMYGIAIGIEDEIIHLVDLKNNDARYYRNNEDALCVPKRGMNEVLIGSY